MKRFGAVITLYALLAVAATHPLWQHLADAVPGDVGDPVLNTYILAWDAHALTVDPAGLFNANFFFPLRGTLAFSENLSGTALLALPLMLLSGEPVLTYNLMFLASFVLAGAGMYLLALYFTGRRLAAFAAGVAFAFAPYHIASLSHLQLLTIGWLPLLLLALSRALDAAPGAKTRSGELAGVSPASPARAADLVAGGAKTRSGELAGVSPASPARAADLVAGGAKTRSGELAGVSPASPARAADLVAGGAQRWTPGVLCAVFLWMQVASTLHGALFAALSVLVFAALHGRRLGARRPAPVNLPEYPPPASGDDGASWHGARSSPPPAAPEYGALWRGALRQTRFWLPLAICACLLLPIVLPYAAALDALRAARPPDVALSFSAQPSDFLAAYPGNRWFGALSAVLRTRPGFSEEQVLFMGVAAPLLALVAICAGLAGYGAGREVPRQRRSWLVCFAALAAAALLLASSGALAQALPLAGIMRVPARWAALLTFALAGMAGMGVAWIEERLERLRAVWLSAVACLAALLYLEGFAAPIALADVGTLRGQHAIYYALAQLPGREAVLELPMYTGTKRESAESKRMVASAVHWRPLVNGYSGITPPQTQALAGQLSGFPDETSLAALRALGQQGVRYLIVHAGEPGIPRRDWNQTNRARAIASGVLRLVQTIDDNDLMEIVGP